MAQLCGWWRVIGVTVILTCTGFWLILNRYLPPYKFPYNLPADVNATEPRSLHYNITPFQIPYGYRLPVFHLPCDFDPKRRNKKLGPYSIRLQHNLEDKIYWAPQFAFILRLWYVPGFPFADQQILDDQSEVWLRKCPSIVVTSLPEKWVYREVVRDPGHPIYHNAIWARHTKTCYINIFPTCQPPPRYPQPDAYSYILRELNAGKYMSRYYGLNALQEHISPTVSLLYADGDVLFTNTSATFNVLNRRIATAAGLPTVEDMYPDQELAAEQEANPAANPAAVSLDTTDESAEQNSLSESGASRIARGSADKIAMVATMEGHCVEGSDPLNSGVLHVRPGKVARYISETVIALTNYTRGTLSLYGFDRGDQGRLTWLFREAFDMDIRKLRIFCNKLEPLVPSCLGSRFLMRRPIQLEKVYNSHPILRYPALDHLGANVEEARKALRDEPDEVAIVCTRWMNSPVSNWYFLCSSDKRAAISYFNCGDMVAHIPGETKDAFEYRNTRKRLLQKPECVAVWPTDQASFDASHFIRMGRRKRTPVRWNYHDTVIDD